MHRCYEMDLESYFDLMMQSTSEPSTDSTKWSTQSKLGMLFIEFRPMDIIKYNLWNIANVYGGGDTALTIVHSGDNREMIVETTKDWENVRYIQAFETNKDVNAYSKLLASYDFWDNFSNFEHILINQWDSYIFKKIPEKFLGYDFVGAPTSHFYVPLDGRIMNICSSRCQCDRCKVGDHPYKEDNFIKHPGKILMFNGGFSLRNVSTMKLICKNKQWIGEPEDVYFCLTKLKKPTRNEARFFSVQDYKADDTLPVGCHQIWLSQDEAYIRDLFKKYQH
jgi:hypothetical protein